MKDFIHWSLKRKQLPKHQIWRILMYYSFIGQITHYAKFLPNMATLLAPVYKLLKGKIKLKWEAQQKEAFTKVKEVLQNSSMLMHFENKKEVVLLAMPIPMDLELSYPTKL